jgi:hypothetical protein
MWEGSKTLKERRRRREREREREREMRGKRALVHRELTT